MKKLVEHSEARRVIDVAIIDLKLNHSFTIYPTDYNYTMEQLQKRNYKVVGIKSNMATSFKVKKESFSLFSIEAIV